MARRGDAEVVLSRSSAEDKFSPRVPASSACPCWYNDLACRAQVHLAKSPADICTSLRKVKGAAVPLRSAAPRGSHGRAGWESPGSRIEKEKACTANRARHVPALTALVDERLPTTIANVDLVR